MSFGVVGRMRVMNEILLAATMAWMSANFALLPLPGWPLLPVGPSYQLSAVSHSELYAIGETEIWCALPSGPAWHIEWHDCRVSPTRQGVSVVSRSGGTIVLRHSLVRH